VPSAPDHDSPVGTGPHRPPIRVSTLVRSGIDHTFDAFVRTIGAWWPVQPFSAGKQRVRDIVIEPATGGRVYEIWDDGTTVDWGDVIVWEPPTRFTMSWRGTPAVTEVEVTFQPLGPALTRVCVEHRGWDALTEEQLGEDCALPGGYASGAYRTGWERILGRFATAADRTHTAA
jgi:Activator of Hsp90 ATPase homolog 1-like protein